MVVMVVLIVIIIIVVPKYTGCHKQHQRTGSRGDKHATSRE
jgi:competence protein ComGC